jgi:hypothetical protein
MSMSISIPSNYQRLEQSQRRPAAGARVLGDADPAEALSVTIVVRRRDGGDPQPRTGGAMSREDFAQRHGASEADMQRVVDFVQSHGLRVLETHASRRTVVAAGTVSEMNKAFGVDLKRYERPGHEHYRGREGFIHLPAELTDVVEGVFGLDNRTIGGRNHTATEVRPRANLRKPRARIDEGGVNAGDPPNTDVLTVPKIAGLYKFPTNSASGQTIGILEMGGGYLSTDIQTFFSTQGLTTPSLTDVGIDGSSNSPGGLADGEVVLDICVAGAVAQGAAIAVYFAPGTQQGWVDAITRAVHPDPGDPVPSVISISWYITNGDDDTTHTAEGVTTAEINAVSAAFKDAAALGITVLIASGDTGSDSKVGDGKAHVQYPGSDPWVTSCGGTTVGNVSGSSFSEVVWNDTFFGGASGATGGGISDFFGLPDYQSSAGVPASANPGNHHGRGVPDIAGNASPNSGYDIWVGGTKISGGGNGTSAVSPLYAGLIAVCNAALGQNIGFLNPLLYAVAGTGVVRDIADGNDNALNGAPGYTAGGGWDACTGLGVIEGSTFLAALQARFTKAVTIITDRSTFGQDEVTGMLHVSTPAVVEAAFYVTVDGFTPAELGLTSASPTPAQLQAAAPVFTMSPNVSGMAIQVSGFKPELPSLPAQPQRFTFIYRVVFQDISGFTAPQLFVTLTAATHGTSAQAVIELIQSPNPFMIDGPVSWLSTDLRVFQLRPGDSLPGLGSVTMGSSPSDAPTFIKGVINGFNGMGPFNHPFDLISTDENTSQVELSEKVDGVPVFNFAVCRVRVREFADNATDVRVFFRLFQASTTDTNYAPATTYLSGGAGGTKVPLLGLVNGALETIPCFAEPRVDTGSTGMDQQADPANVQTFVADGTGNEQDFYFGCWLDINQPGILVCPASPPNATGPFSSGRKSVQDLVRNQHQCLVAEIAYDPDPIPNGVSVGSSDKLAQRNLAIVQSDNPGSVASHRIANTFDVKATKPVLPPGWHPDELMIDWGGTPPDSEVQIYLPAADADEILRMAASLYGVTTLKKIDDHTLGCKASGMTWVPLPPGSGPNYAGLMTIDLPETVKRGQSFTVVVKQVTSGVATQLPPPPPVINAKLKGAAAKEGGHRVAERTEARRIHGAYQITIPVTKKAHMLPAEERLFSVLRWIGQSIDGDDRWLPVFERYVGIVGDRVKALGGDPGHIRPSPDGSGVKGEHAPHPGPGPHHGGQHRGEQRLHLTGKVDGLVYDRFGDFDGFMLDTEDGERRFHCREPEMAELLHEAWSQRLLVTVVVEEDCLSRPERVILRSPPPSRMR